MEPAPKENDTEREGSPAGHASATEATSPRESQKPLLAFGIAPEFAERKAEIDTIALLTFHDTLLRASWLEFVDPADDYDSFARRSHKGWQKRFVATVRNIINLPIPADSTFYTVLHAVPLLPSFLSSDWLETLHEYDSLETFMDVAFSGLDPSDPQVRYLCISWQSLKQRVSKLSPDMIGAIRSISHEYMIWLSKNPKAVGRVAWEAFEQIVAELFAAKGFHVDLTGRLKDRSSDIVAVTADEFGIETRYLIECKK